MDQWQSRLICPKCKGVLKSTAEGLVCEHDALVFAVRDGIPIMLLNEATPYVGSSASQTI